MKQMFRHFKNKLQAKPPWVFVSGHEAWILKRISKEIDRRGDLNAKHYPTGYRLPRADFYFFAHYSRLIQFLEDPKENGTRIVFFTHFEDNGRRKIDEVVDALHQADKVICMSSSWKQWLVHHGLDVNKVSCILCGADPAIFQYHERSDRTVGFVSRFYPRKSPAKMSEIVKRMPDKAFVLIGPNWDKYSEFSSLQSLPNFQCLDIDYSLYPSVYARMDVFVSVSRIEGGPIPLIESMMSNVVPVVSRTGFAPDIIRHGENGFLFDGDADVETIVSLIREAFQLGTNVRETVEHLTWENFTRQVLDFVYR